VNVLVIEDEHLQWSALEMFLRSRGDTPYWASKAVQAYDWLAKEKIDLVLLDVELGVGQLSGIDVLRAMIDHDEWREIPIIIVTGTPDDRIRELAKPPVRDVLSHVRAMLEKPVDLENLERTIRLTMEHYGQT
jgi:DNA-binding response OmpR family regulator